MSSSVSPTSKPTAPVRRTGSDKDRSVLELGGSFVRVFRFHYEVTFQVLHNSSFSRKNKESRLLDFQKCMQNFQQILAL